MLTRALQQLWYTPTARVPLLLRGLAALYARLAAADRRRKARRAQPLSLPVVVVGNISVGGTGKTPVVIELVRRLQAAGLRPAVVSRGYGGRPPQRPFLVAADTSASQSGDEPLLIARRCGVPVMVDPQRRRAVAALAARGDVDIVIADDGLQHLQLPRLFEIAVVDGERGLGNGRLLPAGPLREPATRLQTVDWILVNGGSWQPAAADTPWLRFGLRSGQAYNMAGQCCSLQLFAQRQVHAVAGIGHPERFFAMLERDYGMRVLRHPFPDHHVYRLQDLQFRPALPLLMTEKDAVKCAAFTLDDAWAVSVDAELSPAGDRLVRQLLDRLAAQPPLTSALSS